jgi:hypothetical protein
MQFYQSLLNIQDTPSRIKEGALKCLEGNESFENLFMPFRECLQTENIELISIGIQGTVHLLTSHDVGQESVMELIDLITAKYDKDVKIASVLVKCLGKIVLESEILSSNSLLKAIKTVYSIFLTCYSSQVQVLAQSTIYRMVHRVFSMSLSNAVNSEGFVTETDEGSEGRLRMSKNEKIRNAYVVFRALCKLSMKPVQDGSQETKSQALRSKYLALHLIQSLLVEKIDVFYWPAGVWFNVLIKLGSV